MSDPSGPSPADSTRPTPWSRPTSSGAPAYPGPTEQPTYPQPGSAQPGSPQPGYPPAGGGQPGYLQAPNPPVPPGNWPSPPNPPVPPGNWPYPALTQPMGVPPRQRRGRLIALIIGLVLLLCGGLSVGLFAIGSQLSRSNPVAGPSRAGAVPSTTGAIKISFVAPDRIGSLQKSAVQTQAETMKSSLRTRGLEDPFAAVYEDSGAVRRPIVVWGGIGRIFRLGGDKRQLDVFFTGLGSNLGGGTVGPRIDVDPGQTGGTAECARVDGMGMVMAACVWVTNGALLAFLVTGVTPETAGEDVRQMLPAIVVRG